MIALDAGVLIAFVRCERRSSRRRRRDVRHQPVGALTIGPINQAEVLVRAARENRDQQMLADLRVLGITTTALPDDAATRLARLRANTRSKMPDCCVLLTAEQMSARVATFDNELKEAARSLGLAVV